MRKSVTLYYVDTFPGQAMRIRAVQGHETSAYYFVNGHKASKDSIFSTDRKKAIQLFIERRSNEIRLHQGMLQIFLDELERATKLLEEE